MQYEKRVNTSLRLEGHQEIRDEIEKKAVKVMEEFGLTPEYCATKIVVRRERMEARKVA